MPFHSLRGVLTSSSSKMAHCHFLVTLCASLNVQFHIK